MRKSRKWFRNMLVRRSASNRWLIVVSAILFGCATLAAQQVLAAQQRLAEQRSVGDDDASLETADAPVADAPVADAPVADAPVADAPVADAPVADAPVADAPVADAPVADAPVADAPVAGAPVAGAEVTLGTFQSLFDGKTLAGWKATNFGGEGKIYVEEGLIFLDFGEPMTGITFAADQSETELPRVDYELRLQAKKVDGTDFFCGLTFPVEDACCSLIVGGWGGSLVGLSSLDGQDAARNESQLNMPFKRDVWYAIRMRVRKDRIQVWIDDKRVIDQDIKGRALSVRPEVGLCTPLGICAFQTQAAIRAIQLARLK